MIWRDDATGLLKAYRTGRAAPSEVAEILLERISDLDPVLNAYTNLSQTLREEAAASTARWRNSAPLGPLDGVPIIVKDNLVSAGLPASWGNTVLARRVPDEDERPVAALRAAGALIVGKGNTPEFAVEGFTDNLTFGATRNPFDLDMTPGGSSGGVAAAVAAGLAFAGLATDGGGSIRRPAGYTGLVGLKPGIGRVPRGGGLAQVLLDFEVVGPIARSIRDLRALLGVLFGRHVETRSVGQAHILAVATLGDAPCEPEILKAFENGVRALRGQGHTVDDAAFPYDLARLNEGWSSIAEIGLAAYFARDPLVAKAAAPKYREMAARGAAAMASDLYAVLDAVYALRHAARDLWGYDAVLMPSSAAHPWPATESHPTQIAGQPAGPRGHAVYTGWVNAAGLPALAFPAASDAPLPIGLQLIGPMDGEEGLLDLIEPILSDFRWPDLVFR